MIELVAHRGYAHRYPENTLLALDAAAAAGARYVEVDVQLSADGVPVLFHDHDCARLCGVPGAIDTRPFAAIRALSASERGRFGDAFVDNRIASVADLAEWLGCHPTVTAFVEIKRQAVARFGAAAVVEATWQALQAVLAQTVLISFSLPALAVGRRRWPAIGVVAAQFADLYRPAAQALASDYLFCDITGLPASGSLGSTAPLVVYEVDDADTARALVARGVGLIETFAIVELTTALAAHA
ncbi:MAG: glycerophosphodiester phosphodiesterase family protein [Acidiferrobacter sp.]